MRLSCTNKAEKVIGQLESMREFTFTENDYYIGDSWKSRLKQIAIDFLGIDSPFIEQIDLLNFNATLQSEESLKKYYQQQKNNANQIIYHMIIHIQANGIKKNGNFISRMSEGWVIFWFSIFLTVWSSLLYGIGVYQTQNKIDREKIELKNKADSLLRVTQSFIINTNKSANDSTGKGVDGKSNKNK